VLPKGWQIIPERGVVWLTCPIFACSTVDLQNCNDWDQQCRRRRTTVYLAPWTGQLTLYKA